MLQRSIVLLTMLFTTTFSGMAIASENEAFINQATQALEKLTIEQKDLFGFGRYVIAETRYFMGRPYIADTLDATGEEKLVDRQDGFDCVTFVEHSLARARFVYDQLEGIQRPYTSYLEDIRYRNGLRAGYTSRLHYFSEWIIDNEKRGILENLTPQLKGVPERRTISFMTANAKFYPPLENPSRLVQMMAVESQLNKTPRYSIPKARVREIMPELRPGDIIAITTDIKGLDVVHVGLAYREKDGQIHLLHAPEPGQAVQISRDPLDRYLQKHKRQVGIMVARPTFPQTL